MRVQFGFLALLCLSACGGSSLEGTWTGELDCGSVGDFDMEMTLEAHESKADTFIGSGEIVELTCDVTYSNSAECDLLFEVTVKTEGESGEQDLDFDLDDCEYKIGSDKFDADCSDLDDSAWDGADIVVFELEDCEGELEREE
jgi:hypothetical protein